MMRTIVVEQKAIKRRDNPSTEIGCWMRLRFMLGCISVEPKSVSSSPEEMIVPQAQANPDEATTSAQPPSTSTTSSGMETPSRSNGEDDKKISAKRKKFSFCELKSATKSFKSENLLGEGGFGRVYKGWINGTSPAKPGTGLAVAVKMLNPDGAQGHKEWLTEVNFLGDLCHLHLVNLIGYCIEDDQRLLVYEFMPRGSLENHLFRRSLPLSWPNRMKIALGAAKGLAYLHEETEKPVIIYRDFKTSNILLDADYNAKLSDFGLAKDGPEGERTHVSTRVMGTYGYAAPEYVMTGHLTAKSDVYSFGVVLLEILTGRRSMDKTRPVAEHNLVEWARPQLADRRKVYRMVDPRMEGRFSMKGVEKAAQVAALCIHRDLKARPAMSEVVEILKPLLHLDDMACFSSYFQARQIQIQQLRSRSSGRSSCRLQTGPSNGRTGRSLSTPNRSLPISVFHALGSP